MSEVKRYTFKGAAGEYVYSKDFDRVTAERDALQVRLNESDELCDSLERSMKNHRHELGLVQQRLTAADERADVLEGQLAERESELEEFSIEMTLAISDSQIRSAMTVIGRSRFLQLLQAYNARIDAALKPAEPTPCCTVSAEDQALLDAGDYTPEELFGVGGKPSCPKCAKP